MASLSLDVPSPQTFYLAQIPGQNGDAVESFGLGNPPHGAISAFGGGVPMIVNGLKYGSTNLYEPGVTSPLTGDPGKSSSALLQRSNSGFAVIESKYEQGGNFSMGKVIIGYSSKSDAFALVVQADGAKVGMSMSAIRDRLYSAGFDNALAFDGSSSATLIRNNAIQVKPAIYKNGSIDVGIGFKRNGK